MALVVPNLDGLKGGVQDAVCEHLTYDEVDAKNDVDALLDDLGAVQLDIVSNVLVKFLEMSLWMFCLSCRIVVLEPVDDVLDALLVLPDDVVLDPLLGSPDDELVNAVIEPLGANVVEFHLVQLLDGKPVFARHRQLLDLDVGP